MAALSCYRVAMMPDRDRRCHPKPELRSYEERSGLSRRVERIILANLNLNLTTDFSQSRLDETRGVYVRPFPLLFNRCCFLSRPAKDTRGEIRPEVSWKFFLLILVVLSWDRVVNNLTVDRASDRRWIEISREGRNIKEFWSRVNLLFLRDIDN